MWTKGKRRLQQVFCCRDMNESEGLDSIRGGSGKGHQLTYLILWPVQLVCLQGMPADIGGWVLFPWPTQLLCSG